MSQRRLNVLLLCDFKPGNANVIRDYLYSFNAYSRHRFYYYHQCLDLDGSFDFSRFDAIVFFWDCLWFWNQRIDRQALKNVARAPGLKVLFQQDEYRYVRPNNRLLAKFGIQVLMTLVEPRQYEFIYPRERIPSLQACYTVLPGYVPDYMTGRPLTPLADRPIDIGYRSRVFPYHLGDLAREKLIIAQRFEQIAHEHGFSADISVHEADRLYGEQWLDFLQSCRFVLGTESGASVIDLSGDIERRCIAYLRRRPKASYEEVRARFFAGVDGKPVMTAVAPRVFEAVACGGVLVQHEGEYGGLLQPDEHYIAVKKDYSNVAEVVARMRDLDFCERLRANAYRDLIASGRYSYQALVQRFDDILGDHVPARAPAAPSRIRFYAANYLRRGQRLVPKGSRFAYLPWPSLAPLTAVIGWAASALQWPWQVLLLLALLLDVPVLRRVLLGGMLCPWRWRRLRLGTLWPDLLRLSTMRYARGGGGPSSVRYRIEPTWDTARTTCSLVSVVLPRATPAPPVRLRNALRRALAAGRVRRLLWDHGAAARGQATFGVGRWWTHHLPLRRDTRWDFCHLLQFCRDNRVDLLALVGQLTDGRPSALRCWSKLRLPLLLLVVAEVPAQMMAATWQTIRLRYRMAVEAWRNHGALRLLLLLGLLTDVPTLRRSLTALLWQPRRWRSIGMPTLAKDLIRLACIRAAGGRGPVLGESFRIDAAWHADRRVLELQSAPVPHPRLTVWRPPPQIPTGDGPWQLTWDHSAVEDWLWVGALSDGNLTALFVWMGVGGTWRFRGLSRLMRAFAAEPAAVAAELLQDAPCALRTRRWLRLLIRGFVCGQRLTMAAQWLWRDPIGFAGCALRKPFRVLFRRSAPITAEPVEKDEPESRPRDRHAA